MRAFDLDVLSRPECLRFHFLQQPSAAGAAHFNPIDGARSALSSLLGEKEHGNSST
jgi:hypothetical protein